MFINLKILSNSFDQSTMGALILNKLKLDRLYDKEHSDIVFMIKNQKGGNVDFDIRPIPVKFIHIRNSFEGDIVMIVAYSLLYSTK